MFLCVCSLSFGQDAGRWRMSKGQHRNLDRRPYVFRIEFSLQADEVSGNVDAFCGLGDHPKPATCDHLKTGHSE
jgi:hypothetical protein